MMEYTDYDPNEPPKGTVLVDTGRPTRQRYIIAKHGEGGEWLTLGSSTVVLCRARPEHRYVQLED